MLYYQLIIIFMVLVIPIRNFCMEDNQCNFHYVIMPGLGNQGLENRNNSGIIPAGQPETILSQPIHSKDDLGQSNWQKEFVDNIINATASPLNNPSVQQVIFAALGTGAHGLLCSFNKIPSESKVACIYLESPMQSTHSAIMHYANTMFSFLTHTPFSRLWIPLLAKLNYPCCKPFFGLSALKCVQRGDVPNNIPVILVHNKNNHQVHINDSRELYCALKENGNDNVYLIEINGVPACSYTLQSGTAIENNSAVEMIQQIYKTHDLPYDANKCRLGSDDQSQTVATAINKFKPSIEQVEARIKKDNPNFYRNVIDTISLCVLGSFIYYKWFK